MPAQTPRGEPSQKLVLTITCPECGWKNKPATLSRESNCERCQSHLPIGGADSKAAMKKARPSAQSDTRDRSEMRQPDPADADSTSASKVADVNAGVQSDVRADVGATDIEQSSHAVSEQAVTDGETEDHVTPGDAVEQQPDLPESSELENTANAPSEEAGEEPQRHDEGFVEQLSNLQTLSKEMHEAAIEEIKTINRAIQSVSSAQLSAVKQLEQAVSKLANRIEAQDQETRRLRGELAELRNEQSRKLDALEARSKQQYEKALTDSKKQFVGSLDQASEQWVELSTAIQKAVAKNSQQISESEKLVTRSSNQLDVAVTKLVEVNEAYGKYEQTMRKLHAGRDKQLKIANDERVNILNRFDQQLGVQLNKTIEFFQRQLDAASDRHDQELKRDNASRFEEMQCYYGKLLSIGKEIEDALRNSQSEFREEVTERLAELSEQYQSDLTLGRLARETVAATMSPDMLRKVFDEYYRDVRERNDLPERQLLVERLPEFFDIVAMELRNWTNLARQPLDATSEPAYSEETCEAMLQVVTKLQRLVDQWHSDNKLVRFSSPGDRYDVTLHEAIKHVPTNIEADVGKIKEVMRSGYLFRDSDDFLRRPRVAVWSEQVEEGQDQQAIDSGKLGDE